MEKQRLLFTKWLLFWVIMLGITSFWRLLEVLIDGRIQERPVDTIIGFILCYSIYKNFDFAQQIKDLKNFKKQREENHN